MFGKGLRSEIKHRSSCFLDIHDIYHLQECTTLHSEVFLVKPSSGCTGSRNNECAQITYYCLQIFVSYGYLKESQELSTENSQVEVPPPPIVSMNPFKKWGERTEHPLAKSKELHALLREDERQGATLENVSSVYVFQYTAFENSRASGPYWV